MNAVRLLMSLTIPMEKLSLYLRINTDILIDSNKIINLKNILKASYSDIHNNPEYVLEPLNMLKSELISSLEHLSDLEEIIKQYEKKDAQDG